MSSGILFRSSPWSWVVPRAVDQTSKSDVLSATSVFLDVIHKLGVDERRVRVGERFFESVDEDARSGVFHKSIWIMKTCIKR